MKPMVCEQLFDVQTFYRRHVEFQNLDFRRGPRATSQVGLPDPGSPVSEHPGIESSNKTRTHHSLVDCLSCLFVWETWNPHHWCSHQMLQKFNSNLSAVVMAEEASSRAKCCRGLSRNKACQAKSVRGVQSPALRTYFWKQGAATSCRGHRQADNGQKAR